MPDLASLEARIASIETELKDIHARMDQIYEILSERHEGDERITELRFPGIGEAAPPHTPRIV